MPFLSEPEPPRGEPLPVLPGIRRVVARNPSVMTYRGTNTYLIEGEDGLTILDPGPKDEQHVREVLAAADGVPIKRIVLTHSHFDHMGAARDFQAATGLPVQGYKISATKGFTPDILLDEGDEVAGLRAVFTPGHCADHLCFEYFLADGTKILFSGDHVMSWSSSIVSPPDGDMLHYYRSLEKLQGRDEALYVPGHGPVLPEPRALVAELLAHRQYREREILAQIKAREWAVAELAAKLYDKTDPWLKGAAQRNVLAHLLKLRDEGIAEELAPVEFLPDHLLITGAPPGVEEESGGELLGMRRDAMRRFGLVAAI
jgi:glyoxylase-like metal-dependent hydrolase (beta-lactamase superfamily II)